ncbi:substrate-binding domain-containing protein [Micrococcus luteus]|uniref:substrate-binding domain-containing protein n=1 Tax=Micrococcus luteus TaxID=1270 RepID=UPI0029DB9FA3|nr:substrate-binding domain-containing protein [Micrococcus luteus]MCV7713359.1 substrate-binding domain-containing protein [Micrococcus luteus]
MSHRARLAATASLVALAISLTACAPATEYSACLLPDHAPAQEALTEMEGQVLSKGPQGEEPVSADTLELTDDEVDQIKAKKATAAIVMHYTGDDWTAAQLNGLRTRFSELGIEVIGVTDAGQDPSKQVSDIENMIARKPDIMISIPTDAVATAGAYRRAAEAGIDLVFMDNVPVGFEAGEDYISAVSADNYGNGVVSAHLMAQALEGEGNIGVIKYGVDFFVTNQRYEGFTETIRNEYPGIKIIDERGISGSDLAGEAQNAANAMLLRHQDDIDGLWGVWDVPTEGIMAAVRTAERGDVKITTEDLGLNVAIAMAQNSGVAGLGAQRPYDQGVAEATLAAYGLIGKDAPPYVALGALPVHHGNLLEAWQDIYHQEVPEPIQESFVECTPPTN